MIRRLYWIAIAALLLASVGLIKAWSSSAALRQSHRELTEQHFQLAREVHLLRESLARARLAENASVSSVEQPPIERAVGVPRPESDEETEADLGRRVLTRLIQEFPQLTGRAKQDAIEELIDPAREGNAQALRLIQDSLSDDSASVRETAVQAITDLEDTSQVANLEALVDDPDPRVREKVADSLSRMPAHLAGPVLARLLADSNEEVVEEALAALSRMKYQEAVPQILEVARGKNLDLAARAGGALRQMGENSGAREALRRVTRGLDSPKASDRATSIRCLQRVGGEQAATYLRAVVENETNPTVQELARQALYRVARAQPR